MDSAIWGFIGTMVGVVASVGTTFATNMFQLKKEKYLKNFELEQDKYRWEREQLLNNIVESSRLLDSYVYRLLPYKQHLESEQKDEEVIRLSGEVKRC